MTDYFLKNNKPLIFKYLLFLSVVFIWGVTSFASAPLMTFPANTAIAQDPDISKPPVQVLAQSMDLPVLEQKSVVFQKYIVSTEVVFFRVMLPDGHEYWLSPSWQIVNGIPRIVDSAAPTTRFAAGALLFLGLLFILLYVHRCATEKRQGKALSGPWLLVAALILFHWAWLKFFNSVYPGAFQSPTDDAEYYRIAQGLLTWDFSRHFHYTLGYPIFIMPFILLMGHENSLALAQTIGAFSGLVMMPVNIILGFWLLRRICNSAWIAFSAIALWQLIPKIFILLELPTQGVIFSPLGLFHSDYIFQAYQFCLMGLNPLSEWCSVLLVFSVALIASARSGQGWRYPLAGAILGLACLVRLNNVFWAPLVVYLFWRSDCEKLVNWRYLLKMALLAGAAFWLVFVWQLVVNRIQFGNCLTFPYILHSAAIHAGFQFGNLIGSSNYNLKILAVPLCWTFAGLAVMRHAPMRNALILWVLPMLFFFCGFSVTGQHYRFFMPLFYGMTAAVVAVEFWPRLNWPRRLLMATTVLLLVLPMLPFAWTWNGPGFLPLIHFLRQIAVFPLLALCLWLFWRDWQALGFIGLTAVLVLLSLPLVYLAVLILLLIYAMTSILREIWSFYRQRRGALGEHE